MRNDPLLELTGVKLMLPVAGFLGAVVQLSWNKHLSLWGAIASVIAGVCCASFGTPLINWYYELPVAVENGTAFLLGLLGLMITGKVYQFFAGLTVERVLGLFTNKKGGGDE
jgi:hypothetical protein